MTSRALATMIDRKAQQQTRRATQRAQRDTMKQRRELLRDREKAERAVATAKAMIIERVRRDGSCPELLRALDENDADLRRVKTLLGSLSAQP